ncbi:YdeI family protein [Tenacibaculum sp. UWU-22]|uniref:YdeI/OmpD-associated family protein n=1 Tax=Tenacibaculum sp. UWU-22 TaxID=3234187 RepID=UPI0034DB3E0B
MIKTIETVESSPTLRVKNVSEWRNWLERNCEKEKIIWLIVYHKSSKTPSVHWHDAIENALCYGWVDSKAKKRDKESCYLKFTPRNPKSNWGKRSKERALRMIEQNLMTEHGLNLIKIAKENGKWNKNE